MDIASTYLIVKLNVMMGRKQIDRTLSMLNVSKIVFVYLFT